MRSVQILRAGLAASASLGVLAWALSGPALAQTYQELPGLVIEGAGLAPVDSDKTGSSYSVITGEELEKRQIRHAADALREIPGLAVNQTGSSGSLTQVRVRGAEGNHVVVRIDGVEVNGLSDGGFDFSTLLVHDIDRIEVVRGPQSGVFGGNALAGVINVITKKGIGPARVTASAEGGSMNTRSLSASTSGGSERGYFSVSAADRSTSGFNIAQHGSEKDGSEQKTIFTRAGVTLVDNFHIDGMFRYQFNKTDADSEDWVTGVPIDLAGYTNQREQLLGSVTATLDLFDKHWQHQVFVDGFRDDFESLYPGSPIYTNSGDRTHWGYQSSWNFETPSFLAAKHTLTGLAEQRHESFEQSVSTIEHKREQTSYVAEYRGEYFDHLILTGNIRRDLNDAFNDATTYRLAAAYLLKDTDTRLHTSYGKGIKNPTFVEQFGLNVWGPFYGNPNLRPEQSLGWDVGIEQKLWKDALVLDVTYFDADLTDKITAADMDVNGDGLADHTVINADGKSKRQGVEVTLTARPMAGLVLTGSYTYTNAEDANGVQEIRRPQHAASIHAAYVFLDGRAEINGGVTYNGTMADKYYSAPAVWLDDYVLVDIGASYKFDERITFFGRIENLLDTDYEQVAGYNSAPVAAYGGMKVSFTDDRPLEPLK